MVEMVEGIATLEKTTAWRDGVQRKGHHFAVCLETGLSSTYPLQCSSFYFLAPRSPVVQGHNAKGSTDGQ